MNFWKKILMPIGKWTEAQLYGDVPMASIIRWWQRLTVTKFVTIHMVKNFQCFIQFSVGQVILKYIVPMMIS